MPGNWYVLQVVYFIKILTLRISGRNIACDGESNCQYKYARLRTNTTSTRRGNTNHLPKMAVSSSLSLTEDLFRATRLNKYKETIDQIRPGSGLLEKMFEGSQHAANYVLDTRLTFKVNKWKKGKTTKTKKVLNPNIMFTMFGVFCDKSAGAVRKELCEWISANLESFKRQCFMGMASKDMDFDDWFAKLKSNDTVCDEFGLSALCQAFQRHALMMTSQKILFDHTGKPWENSR